MANERRIRPNYLVGTLDQGLAVGDTALVAQALTRLPVIDTTNYAVLSLIDPVAAVYEIVYVIAHAAGAGTATIVRGQEGSTARAWPASTTFVAAPTSSDFRPSLDDAWAGDLGYDEDFTRSGATTPPSPWGWVTQNGASYLEDRGWGNIITPGYASGSGFYNWQLYRPLPVPATWTATVRLAGSFPRSPAAGQAENPTFGLRLNSTGAFVHMEYRPHAQQILVSYFINLTTYSVSPVQMGWSPAGYPVYLQISKTGANTYSFGFSSNGSAFAPVLTGYTPAFTPDSLILGAVQEGGPVSAGVTSFDWLRVR